MPLLTMKIRLTERWAFFVRGAGALFLLGFEWVNQRFLTVFGMTMVDSDIGLLTFLGVEVGMSGAAELFGRATWLFGGMGIKRSGGG